MRHDIHPAYGPVVYQDRSTGQAFLTRSTATSRPSGWRSDAAANISAPSSRRTTS
jgi:ribosomal protein L31